MLLLASKKIHLLLLTFKTKLFDGILLLNKKKDILVKNKRNDGLIYSFSISYYLVIGKAK